MSWLTKFKTDPLNLVGPNVSKAPIREIDLSGTILSFNCPPQTAEIPGFMGDNQFDINSGTIKEYSVGIETIISTKIYSSGWDFNDRTLMGKEYGGVDLDIHLFNDTAQQNLQASLMNERNIEEWLYVFMESTYGTWNKEIWEKRDSYVNTITPEKSFWQYPKSKGDLQWFTFNQHNWVRYEVFEPEKTPSIEFLTAISHRHIVHITWKPGAYDGRDFFSSKHNLRAATKAFIDQMMSGMKITLSAEAQKQFDELKYIDTYRVSV